MSANEVSYNGAMNTSGQLIDTYGRVHDALRISVTDRCNIRCFYCMPAEPVGFLATEHLLSFEQIARIVRVLSAQGVHKLRITGGEPLLRPKLPELIRMLAGIEGITDLALTTNGMLLEEFAEPLRNAGLKRLNVSLDTLLEATFEKISRRKGLDRVLRGIEQAQAVGFEQLRLNAIAIRDLTEVELIPLTEFAIQRGLHLRFIEYMPLDADHRWERDRVLSGATIVDTLEQHFGTLTPVPRADPSQPAEDFRLPDGKGTVGVIRPVTEPFCGACNRLRLTAEGKLRNCLFSLEEWDIKASVTDAELLEQIRACLQAKRAGHLISKVGFEQPQRTMHQIGG